MLLNNKINITFVYYTEKNFILIFFSDFHIFCTRGQYQIIQSFEPGGVTCHRLYPNIKIKKLLPPLQIPFTLHEYLN